MLRGLHVLPGRALVRNSICLSAHGRGIFCRFHYFRARPLAPSTCSTAARLIGSRYWLAPQLRDEEKENSTEGFYEIPDDDRGGYRAGRHSERNFALG